MPSSFNGIGTIYYGYGAAIQWDSGVFSRVTKKADHDAVECFILFFLPLLPIGGFHTWGWKKGRETCRAIPIRSPRHLIARAMLRGWLGLSLPISAISGLIFVADIIRGINPFNASLFYWFLIFFPITLLSIIGLIHAIPGNRRDRDIRLVMGQHQLGSSDPAMWDPEIHASMKQTSELFGTESLKEGIRTALKNWKFGLAMFGARLAVARGDIHGEDLTDEILSHSEVRGRLPEIRKKPWMRNSIFRDDVLPDYLNDETIAHTDQ